MRMQFPDDATLLARGKYSTLNKERKKQLERVQTACKTLMHCAGQILSGVQEKPPADAEYVMLAAKCVANATKGRDEIVVLTEQLNELEKEAWPKE